MAFSDLFTEDELWEDFEVLESDKGTISGIPYVCPTRKVVDFIRKSEFDEFYYKSLVKSILLDEGYTHIYKVVKQECQLSFDLKTLEDAICVMVTGAKL